MSNDTMQDAAGFDDLPEFLEWDHERLVEVLSQMSLRVRNHGILALEGCEQKALFDQGTQETINAMIDTQGEERLKDLLDARSLRVLRFVRGLGYYTSDTLAGMELSFALLRYGLVGIYNLENPRELEEYMYRMVDGEASD